MNDAMKELLDALRRIASIENKYNCGDWDEITEARENAKKAIAKHEAEFEFPQPDADGWILWNGERTHPKGLPENVQVRVRLRNGCLVDGRVSGNFEWFHFEEPGDIIAYRIVKL